MNENYLQQLIEDSPCFGFYFDPKDKICKNCDLAQVCAQQFRRNTDLIEELKLNKETAQLLEEAEIEEAVVDETTVENPVTVETQVVESQVVETQVKPTNLDYKVEDKPSNNSRKRKKDKIDTKNMSVDELWKLLEELGGTCKKHSNPVIQKMLLIQAINKLQ